MAQLIEFKNQFIKICPVNSSHLLHSVDRGRSWNLLLDVTKQMNFVTDLATDNKLLLAYACKGFFLSSCGVLWTKIVDLQQLEE